MRGEESNQLDAPLTAAEANDEQQQLLQRRLEKARSMGIEGIDGPLDLETKRLIAGEIPPSGTINFLLNDMTWENGPIRQIAGSHLSVANPPTPDEEPEWMRCVH